MFMAAARRRLASAVTALGLCTGSAGFSGELVKDESMRLEVRGLAFPDAHISTLPGAADEKSSPVTDPLNRVIALVKNALEPNPEYVVVGPVAKNEEAHASERPSS